MATSTIKWNVTHQVIDGFGGNNANQDYTGGARVAMEDQNLTVTGTLAGTFSMAENSGGRALESGAVIATFKFNSTPTLVQTWNKAQAVQVGNALQLTSGSSVGSGNLIVVGIMFLDIHANLGTITVQDDLGNAFTAAVNQDLVTDGDNVAIYYLLSATAGTRTVNIRTTDAGGISIDAIAREYSGTATALDKTAGANQTAASGAGPISVSTGNVTTTQNTELAVCFCGTNQHNPYVFTAGSGWGNLVWTGGLVWMTPALADLLYSPILGKGMGMTIMRTALPANTTDLNGTKYLSVIPDINLASDPSRAGTLFKLVCTPWSPPAIYKNGTPPVLGGGNTFAGSTANYIAYSNFMITFVNGLNAQLANGVKVYAIGMQNEPDLAQAAASCVFSAAVADGFVANLDNLIPPNLKIMTPEESTWVFTIAATIWADTNISPQDLITVGHAYPPSTYNPPGGPAGANVWANEMGFPANAYDGSMTNALSWAVVWQSLLITAGASAILAWEYWTYGDSDDEAILSQKDRTWPPSAKKAVCFAHMGLFIRPGALRLDEVDNLAAGTTISAFKSVDGNYVSIFMVNNTAGSVSVTFTLAGWPSGITTLTPYITDATHNVAKQANLTISAGSVSYTIAANTVASLNGQVLKQARLNRHA